MFNHYYVFIPDGKHALVTNFQLKHYGKMGDRFGFLSFGLRNRTITLRKVN